MEKMLLCAAVSLACLTASTAHAEILSADDALQRALKSVPQKIGTSKHGQGPRKFTKLSAIRATPQSQIETVYLFNSSDGGYVVVSASDRAPAVLGYGDSGVLSVDDVPPAMKFWLEGYANQIEFLETNKRSANTKPPFGYPDIPALITTKWDQAAPYNDKMPIVNGRTALTGCVATALAQVLNYYQYPERGIGTHSYEWPIGSGTVYSFDYENNAFDWSNMLDHYADNAYSEIQADAVATLMRACAIGVNMKYMENGMSESNGFAAFVALREIFGYPTAENVDQLLYQEDWEAMMYKEIHEGRPMVYSGYRTIESSMLGHAFVLDGYESHADGNYFHFNWGWGGSSNGYYLLNVEGETVNFGANKNPYSMVQDAVIGIEPPHGRVTMTSCEYDGDADHADLAALCIKGVLTNNATEDWTGRIGFDVYPLSEEIEDTPTGYYVRFNNDSGWSRPYVWAWNETEKSVCANPAWPGDPMVQDGGLWTWSAPDGKIPTKIIFSDNGQRQTPDLDYVNGATYRSDGHYETGRKAASTNGENLDTVLYTAYTGDMTVSAGESVDFKTLPWETSLFEVGHSYKAIPRLIPVSGAETTVPTSAVTFTVNEQSIGLSDVAGADEIVGERWYDLQGRPITRGCVQPGIYIVHKLMSDGSVHVSKVSLR